MLIAGLAAGSLVAASAAYAAGLDTAASLSTSASTPSVVSVGDNSFTIDVTASGNVPSDKSGTVTVVTKYTMATDGTITASSSAADRATLNFTTGYNYGQCATQTPANAQGCSANPFVVTADLIVDSGTPAGTTGTASR